MIVHLLQYDNTITEQFLAHLEVYRRYLLWYCRILTVSIFFNSTLFVIRVVCCPDNFVLPTAFSVSSKSWIGLEPALTRSPIPLFLRSSKFRVEIADLEVYSPNTKACPWLSFQIRTSTTETNRQQSNPRPYSENSTTKTPGSRASTNLITTTTETTTAA